MKISLSYSLLDFFKEEGYNYCFSKTSCLNDPLIDVRIDLTPVRQRPDLRILPGDYDTFFSLNKEPVQMAAGVDRTIILMDVSNELLLNYIKYVLKFSKSHLE
jgi:hypothetical protein